MDAGRYAAVSYRSMPHVAGDPDALAVAARLHGLHAPDPDTARVVELGCGDGGNLLAIAAARPHAQLVGFDAEVTAIERGRALATAAGLEHLVLHAADLRELSAADIGRADYVVIHGLWSWVPDGVREAALALARAVIADDGVVSVSYNALPGWHLWMAPRAIARRAAMGEPDAGAAAKAAEAALRRAADLHGRDDLYGRMLAAAIERARERPSEVLFHDDLADECTAFSVTDVGGRAADHGLRYAGEALPAHWWAARVAPLHAQSIRAEGADALTRQQAADLASGVDFKASIFVPDAATPSVEIDPLAALDLSVAARHDAPPLSDGTAPAVRSLFDALLPSATLFVPLREIAGAAGLRERTAAGAALRLAADGHARLAASPPGVASTPGPRPRASALARGQIDQGDRAATLLHEVVTLDDPGARTLLRLLDGSTAAAELPGLLARRAPELPSHGMEAAVGATLQRFAVVGLLEA